MFLLWSVSSGLVSPELTGHMFFLLKKSHLVVDLHVLGSEDLG